MKMKLLISLVAFGATLLFLGEDAEASFIPLFPTAPLHPRAPVPGMRYGIEPASCSTNSSHFLAMNRNGLIDERYRWKNFNVYPDPNYNDEEYSKINDAMWQLQQDLGCISFGIWPRGSNPTGDYVKIVKGSNNGCNSYVGRQGGEQRMNLQSPHCMYHGIIMHEMIHVLGLEHEQVRPDRDDFVNIYWHNIQQGQDYNFYKESTNRVSTFGVPYDFNSIMHYDSYAFSGNGQATMLQKNGDVIPAKPLWQITELSGNDKQKLNIMYKC